MAKQYTKITSITGHTLLDAECVTDPGYFQMMKDNILDMARAGAKMIMLDDDFCLSVRPGIGCACERHMQMFREAVGEEIQREQLPGLLFCGGENKYRSAWMKIMGDSL